MIYVVWLRAEKRETSSAVWGGAALGARLQRAPVLAQRTYFLPLLWAAL